MLSFLQLQIGDGLISFLSLVNWVGKAAPFLFDSIVGTLCLLVMPRGRPLVDHEDKSLTSLSLPFLFLIVRCFSL